METVRLILDNLTHLSWQIVALLIAWWYRDVIRSLLPGAKITLTIVGQKIEATIPEIEQSVQESLGGQPLTPEQRDWLKALYNECRKEIQDTDKTVLRPLRDSGLIKAYPKGFLQQAKAVEITKLGRLLAEQNLA